MEELDKLLKDSDRVEEKIELIEAPVQLKSLFKETRTLGNKKNSLNNITKISY
jgi:hypothetical protein